MSILSTSANYGGRIADNQQGIKQFYVSNDNSTANWIYKRNDSSLYITPEDNKRDAYLNNNLTVKKDLYVDGSIYNVSDARYKKDIQDISNEHINALTELNPVTYYFNDNIKNSDGDKKRQFGLIAQEVQQIFPELVNTTSEGIHTLNYNGFIAIMIAKMKQMQSDIDKLILSNNKV